MASARQYWMCWQVGWMCWQVGCCVGCCQQAHTDETSYLTELGGNSNHVSMAGSQAWGLRRCPASLATVHECLPDIQQASRSASLQTASCLMCCSEGVPCIPHKQSAISRLATTASSDGLSKADAVVADIELGVVSAHEQVAQDVERPC